MNQYIRTSLGVAVIIIMASTIGFFSWTYYQNNLIDAPVTVQSPIKKSEKPMACTEEARLCPDGVNSVGRTEANCEFAECPEIVGLADKLVIESPAPGETISSPISIIGRARGTWFFEGIFPVEVYDGNNKLLGTAPINFTPKSEQDTWMTTEFVDFKGEIKFTQSKTSEGYLLFKKDNPSGNPEMDQSFKLPVKFEKSVDVSSWKNYRNDEIGFEMKYPKDWIAKDYKGSIVFNSPQRENDIKKLIAEGITADAPSDLYVHFYDNFSALQESRSGERGFNSLEEYIQKSSDFSNKKTIIIADEKGWIVNNEDLMFVFYSVYIQHDGKIFVIDLMSDYLYNAEDTNLLLTNLGQGFISTFKFIK